MTNREAVELLAGSLGDFAPALAPLVTAVRGLADLVDSAPEDVQAWREYRFMLAELRKAAGSGFELEDLEAEFARLDAGAGVSDGAKPRA